MNGDAGGNCRHAGHSLAAPLLSRKARIPAPPTSVPQWTQRDVLVDRGVPTEELGVVVGHDAALRVPEDIDFRRARRSQHLGDEAGELLRARLNRSPPREQGERWLVAGDEAVGEREDAVAVVGQQRGVRLPVVVLVGEQTVHEHHRIGVVAGRSARPAVCPWGVGVSVEQHGSRGGQKLVGHGELRRRNLRRGAGGGTTAEQHREQNAHGGQHAHTGDGSATLLCLAHGVSSL